MTIDIIQWSDSSGNSFKWVYEGNSEPITNQSVKHINLQSNNSAERKDFYNSAVIYDIQFPGYGDYNIGMCIFSESPFTVTLYVKWNYSSTWERDTIRTYAYQSGDCYSTQYYTSIGPSSVKFDVTGFQDVYYSTDRTYSFNLPAFNNITDYMDFITQPYISNIVSGGGGGATYISTRNAQLKDLESYKDNIIMVSGGGGGGLLRGDIAYPGKDAGGVFGSGENSGTQSNGYAFGLAEEGTDMPGGGGGFYGGFKGVK